jgi:uncharacterized protein (TIGR02599 family)
MEYRPPIQNNLIYDPTGVVNTPGVPNPNWYQQVATWSRPVAENIVLLIISPKRSLSDSGGTGDPRDIAPEYAYDTSSNGLQLVQGGSDFQLPPLVEVTLIALDEVSAARLFELPNQGGSLMSGRFTTASNSSFEQDIKAVEQQLNELKLNYRVFTSTIALRGSKWGM